MALSDLFELLAGLHQVLFWILWLCALLLLGEIALLVMTHSLRKEVRRISERSRK